MKKSPPYEFLALTAYIMRVFPEREDALIECEKEIAALCRAPGINDTGVFSTTLGASEPERIIEAKEANFKYQALQRYVEAVRYALSKLKDDEKEVIDLSYWQDKTNREISRELHKDVRTVQRLRTRALRVMMPYFVSGDIILPEILN